MTNKLPVVGKRYKRESQEYKCVGLNLYGTNFYFKMLRDKADLSKEYNLCDFYQFEELPEDKAETKPRREEQTISFQDAIYDLKHEVENIQYSDDLKINPASIVEDALQKKLARLVDKAEEVINTEIKPETQGTELSPRQTIYLHFRSQEKE